MGKDILLGTGIAATITLLGGKAPEDYPEQVASDARAAHARDEYALRPGHADPETGAARLRVTD